MIKKLENELLKQKIFFENIISGMRDWVRVVDKNGIVIFMNDPMKNQLGNNVGKKCYLSLQKDSPCENCISNKAFIEDRVANKEEIVGERIYSVVSSPIKDKEGNINCAVEVFRDITEAKAMEALVLQQNQKMKNDLSFAKELQYKMLPKNGIYGNNVKIESLYIPSEILGGDVYDVIEIDEDNIGMYIADVSGHGVTSSMMTMFIRQTLKNLGENAKNPEKALEYLFQRYRELNIDDHYYITIFYGVYNRNNQIFSYTNGGHNCMPIIIRQQEVLELELPGLPICTIIDEADYERKSIKLNKGDKVLYYTDGITESRNHKKEFFGGHRIIELCKNNTNIDIKDLLDIIIEEVKNFSKGNMRDDRAIMIGEII